MRVATMTDLCRRPTNSTNLSNYADHQIRYTNDQTAIQIRIVELARTELVDG